MTTKRKHLTLAEKIKILECHEEEQLSARRLAEKFHIGRTQATELVKNKAEIQKLWVQNGDEGRKHVKVRKTECTAVNDVVYEWFCAARAKNVPISGPLIQEKALKVSQNLNISKKR